MGGDRARTLTALTGFVAFAVGTVLQLRHSGQHEANEVHPLLHGARDVALSVPLFAAAIVVGLEKPGVLKTKPKVLSSVQVASPATPVSGSPSFVG